MIKRIWARIVQHFIGHKVFYGVIALTAFQTLSVWCLVNSGKQNADHEMLLTANAAVLITENQAVLFEKIEQECKPRAF